MHLNRKANAPYKNKSAKSRHKYKRSKLYNWVRYSRKKPDILSDEAVFLGVSESSAGYIWKRVYLGLFSVVIVYSLIMGGHINSGTNFIVSQVDVFVKDAGFAIKNIVIVGDKRSDENKIREALITKRVSLPFFDTQEARKRIENLKWVSSAQVTRFFPSTLKVSIIEREPYAIWQNKGKHFLLDNQGMVIKGAQLEKIIFTLPLIVGNGADKAAKSLLKKLKEHKRLTVRLKAALRVARRRWTLRLNNDVEILLPEKDISQALSQLTELEKQYGLLSGNIKKIDMRLPDRITLKQS